VRRCAEQLKISAIGARGFTGASSGKVKVIVAVTSKARAYLRRHQNLKATITVRLGSRSFRATVTIRPPAAPTRR
jgi:hypothetical protein